MAEPARFDDTFVAGDTYPLSLTLVDKDVTGGSATLHIRRNFNDTPVVIVEGTVGTTNGLITFTIPPEATRVLDSARDGYHKFVYNIQLTEADGTVQTLLVGSFRVLRDLAV